MGGDASNLEQARVRDWTTGPAKWGSAGFLGGASVVGLVWVLGAREPAPLVRHTNAAIEISPELAALQSPAPISEQLTPEPAPVATEPTTDAANPEPGAPAEFVPPTEPAPDLAPEPAPTSDPAPDDDEPEEDLPESPLVDLEPSPAPAPRDPEPAPEKPLSVRIRVNVASAAELELLPGVGPVIARRIAEDRAANGSYRSLRDLQRVKGIGPKTAEKLADHVRFD